MKEGIRSNEIRHIVTHCQNRRRAKPFTEKWDKRQNYKIGY